jgi:hypothetical protein
VVQLGCGGWNEEGRGTVKVAQWYPDGLHGGGEACDSQWDRPASGLAESEAEPVMQQDEPQRVRTTSRCCRNLKSPVPLPDDQLIACKVACATATRVLQPEFVWRHMYFWPLHALKRAVSQSSDLPRINGCATIVLSLYSKTRRTSMLRDQG